MTLKAAAKTPNPYASASTVSRVLVIRIKVQSSLRYLDQSTIKDHRIVYDISEVNVWNCWSRTSNVVQDEAFRMQLPVDQVIRITVEDGSARNIAVQLEACSRLLK